MHRRRRLEARRSDEAEEDHAEQNVERPEEATDRRPNNLSAERFVASLAGAGGSSETLNPPHVASMGIPGAVIAGTGRASARRPHTNAAPIGGRNEGPAKDNVARAAGSTHSAAFKRGSKSDKSSLESIRRKSGDNSSGRKRSRERRKRPPPQDRGDTKPDDEEVAGAEEPVLAALLERLKVSSSREDPAEGGQASDTAIDVKMARYLLEASDYNIDLAASLYYEAGGARPGVQGAGSNESDDWEEEPELMQWQRDNDNAEGVDEQADSEEDDERRVRRRLDQQFEAVDGNRLNEEAAVGPAVEEDQLSVDDAPPEEANAVPDPEEQEAAAEEDHGESVSVSDDEVAAAVADGWRIVGSLAGHLDDEDEEELIARANRVRRIQRINRDVRPQQEARLFPRHAANNVVDEEGDDSNSNAAQALKESVKSSAVDGTETAVDYDTDFSLSDEDWLMEEHGADHVPTELLWGMGTSDSSGDNEASADRSDSDHNIVAEETSSADPSHSSIGIPLTWLRTGFSMSKCGTGVVAKPPPEDEVRLIQQRQLIQRGGNTSKAVSFPPFHCGGITALLSIVTGLLYTGASIQGTEVNCNLARKPFAELSEKERVKEFDSRLTDALSSVLYIAAKASMERKKKALGKCGGLQRSKGGQASDILRDQVIRRKLRLCPTCRWNEDFATSDGLPPEGQHAGKRAQVDTSFSNIQDLRSYVLSNIRTFTGSGGCALFLETILRIHGKSCVASMIRRARKKLASQRKDHSTANALVCCTCEERWKKQRPPASATASDESDLDTIPPGHSCISVELLSLILTGQVHSSLKGWSTGCLELGILSKVRGDVGKALAQSGKNVWILRGEKCYSVMWFSGSKENGVVPSSLERPGCTFQLSHWNCWYGQRNLSGMRVNTARGEWTPPHQTKGSLFATPPKETVTQSILSRRRQQRANVVSSDELDIVDNSDEPVISDDEVDRVVFHPEDENYYPKQYRRWRFNLGTDAVAAERTGMLAEESGSGQLARQENWIPFFRLNSRQKLVVEMSLAPKINRILRTKWPRATVDSFTPVDGPPPLV